MRSKIHIIRIIAYLIQLVLVILCYDFFRNHLFLILMVLVIGAPILSIVGAFVLRWGINLELKTPQAEVRRLDTGFLHLVLSNRSIIPSMECEVQVVSRNTFYGAESKTMLELPVRAMGSFNEYIPIDYTMNGMYVFEVTDIRFRDLLGLVSLRKRVDVKAEVTVLPESERSMEFNTSDMSTGMTESEETIKKGHDFSDVSDVREYIPGDKLMSIHWKLSAKKDSLMVKDRVAMSDQQMVIVTELAGRDEDVDQILTLSYGVCKAFMKDQVLVRLMWWSEMAYEFHERQIVNEEDIIEAFQAMYYEKIYKDSEQTRILMRSIKPELKAYVDICMTPEGANAVVVEQD
ncbi:MAG: DUF58 domain-containing protein [Eubacterium sp.]|nr:DUF58 domain-containing protein [Eubacterium sp.]